jgi:hypothetical protein
VTDDENPRRLRLEPEIACCAHDQFEEMRERRTSFCNWSGEQRLQASGLVVSPGSQQVSRKAQFWNVSRAASNFFFMASCRSANFLLMLAFPTRTAGSHDRWKGRITAIRQSSESRLALLCTLFSAQEIASGVRAEVRKFAGSDPEWNRTAAYHSGVRHANLGTVALRPGWT